MAKADGTGLAESGGRAPIAAQSGSKREVLHFFGRGGKEEPLWLQLLREGAVSASDARRSTASRYFFFLLHHLHSLAHQYAEGLSRGSVRASTHPQVFAVKRVAAARPRHRFRLLIRLSLRVHHHHHDHHTLDDEAIVWQTLQQPVTNYPSTTALLPFAKAYTTTAITPVLLSMISNQLKC